MNSTSSSPVKTGIEPSTLIEINGIRLGVVKYYSKNKKHAGEYNYAAVVVSPRNPEDTAVFIRNADAFDVNMPTALRALADEIEKFGELNKSHNEEVTTAREAEKALKEAQKAKAEEVASANLAVRIEQAKNTYQTIRKAVLAGVPINKGLASDLQKAAQFISKHDPAFLKSC